MSNNKPFPTFFELFLICLSLSYHICSLAFSAYIPYNLWTSNVGIIWELARNVERQACSWIYWNKTSIFKVTKWFFFWVKIRKLWDTQSLSLLFSYTSWSRILLSGNSLLLCEIRGFVSSLESLTILQCSVQNYVWFMDLAKMTLEHKIVYVSNSWDSNCTIFLLSLQSNVP